MPHRCCDRLVSRCPAAQTTPAQFHPARTTGWLAPDPLRAGGDGHLVSAAGNDTYKESTMNRAARVTIAAAAAVFAVAIVPASGVSAGSDRGPGGGNGNHTLRFDVHFRDFNTNSTFSLMTRPAAG